MENLNNKQLKVSILTVVYNCQDTISMAIESVLKQTYPNVEYIVIDGCSTDNTLEIVKSYQEKFDQAEGKTLTVVSEKDNGMYDALNKGAKMCSGEIVGQINADDYYEQDAVCKMVELYNKENYDIAWANLNILRGEKKLVKKAKLKGLWVTSKFCHPTMFSKRQILLEFPYACRQMDDDFDYATRVYKAGKKICVLDEVIANYSLGGMSTKRSLKNMRKRIKMKYGTYRRHGFSRFYWFNCFFVELAKFILGK
ncbi:MAG: glycosyltransferase [Clostridia bacterium]|nr:glycosyltransferase [Clostridia bacterium]